MLYDKPADRPISVRLCNMTKKRLLCNGVKRRLTLLAHFSPPLRPRVQMQPRTYGLEEEEEEKQSVCLTACCGM